MRGRRAAVWLDRRGRRRHGIRLAASRHQRERRKRQDRHGDRGRKTVTIEQEASRTSCTYDIKPTYYDAGRGPDDIRVSVTAPGGCAWTATSPAGWVTVVAGASGSGDGTVRLLVQANNGPERRDGPDHRGSARSGSTRTGAPPASSPTWYHAGRGRTTSALPSPRTTAARGQPRAPSRGSPSSRDKLVPERHGPAARRAEQRCGALGDADHRGAGIRLRQSGSN